MVRGSFFDHLQVNQMVLPSAQLQMTVGQRSRLESDDSAFTPGLFGHRQGVDPKSGSNIQGSHSRFQPVPHKLKLRFKPLLLLQQHIGREQLQITRCADGDTIFRIYLECFRLIGSASVIRISCGLGSSIGVNTLFTGSLMGSSVNLFIRMAIYTMLSTISNGFTVIIVQERGVKNGLIWIDL